LAPGEALKGRACDPAPRSPHCMVWVIAGRAAMRKRVAVLGTESATSMLSLYCAWRPHTAHVPRLTAVDVCCGAGAALVGWLLLYRTLVYLALRWKTAKN